MNVKELIPYIEREEAEGRTRRQIFNDLKLTHNERQCLIYHLDKRKPKKTAPADDLTGVVYVQHWYNFSCPKVEIRGKVYKDITRLVIDCGG